MSFLRDNAAKQTAFRHAVLDNGYTPIPNHHKHCYFKTWPTVQTTHEMIDTWGRQLAFQGTGLRVENGLCAIDIDIDDAVIVERIWQRSVGLYPQLREALIRYGRGAHEAWFVRCDELFRRIASTEHVRPGTVIPAKDDPNAEKVDGHRLEAFGGGFAKQMAAYGAHTMNAANTGFEIEYRWENNDTPADVPLAALPLIPKAAVLAMADIATEELNKAGWPRNPRAQAGEQTRTVAYDLTDDMSFECNDQVTRSFSQLADFVAATNNPRCSASWMDDHGLYRNRTRCIVGLTHEGYVTVLELGDHVLHMSAELAERGKPTSDKMRDVAAKMRHVGYVLDDPTYDDAPKGFQDVVFDLLDHWAWCGSRAVPCVPIYRGEELSMTTGNLRTTNLRHSYDQIGPRGGVVRINPVDAWLTHTQRKDVDGYRFMPDASPGIHDHKDGVVAINSYVAPDHVVIDDEDLRERHVLLWEDFLDHLLPDRKEREWFADWLAHKRQNLTVPGVGVIMYAGSFGVGRGSLFEIIGGVFGQRYVNSVSADLLMGASSQGQYTDWMANALIITTDEVLPEGEEGSNMAWRRRKAYEKLKERIDPKPRRMDIIRKGMPNYQDWVYASFLMATNHSNAIPIPRGDRRLVVLTNNIAPLANRPELLDRLNAIRNPELDREFVSCVDQWLAARDVSHFNAHVAPDFAGKSLMQEANISEIDNLVEAVLEDLPYDWAPLPAILDRIDAAMLRNDLREAFPAWRRIATDKIKMEWMFHTRAYLTRDRRTRHMIMVRDPAAAKRFDALTVDERVIQYDTLLKIENVASAKTRALRAGLREV